MSIGIIASSIYKNAGVTPTPVPVVSDGSLTALGLDTINYQINATNSPTAYGAVDLIANLTVDESTGLISGIDYAHHLDSPGTYTDVMTITATNAGGTGYGKLIITTVIN